MPVIIIIIIIIIIIVIIITTTITTEHICKVLRILWCQLYVWMAIRLWYLIQGVSWLVDITAGVIS
jgi:hypothetical protein